MIPVEADLVIVDWSGIVHGAWHERGPEGMLGRAAGELLELLSPPRDVEGFTAPRLVLATDAGLPTHRHALTAELDAPKRYKANRERKPREFWPLVDRLEQLPLALQIPTLAPEAFAPQTWEADDSAAAACRLARTVGLSVLLVTRDKDWRQLVTDEAPAVRWWSSVDQKLLDGAGVIGEHGVPAELLADWLALVGDASDNVPGVEGIGPKAATGLLKAWPGVAAILAEPPIAPAGLADMAKGVERLRRERDKLRKAFADATKAEVDADNAAAALALWKARAAVDAHRADAELSRKLVELRADVPIALDLDEALVGGWDVREVQGVLRSLGCGWLGKGFEARPKRAPRRGAKSDARDGHRSGSMGGAGLGVPRLATDGMDEPGDGVQGPHPKAPQGRPQAPETVPLRSSGGRVPPEPVGAPRGSVDARFTSGVPLLPPGAEGLPDPRAPGRHPVLDPEARAPEDIDEAVVRARMERAGPLARKYLIEDLRAGKRFNLRPGVAERLIAEMEARGVAA